ncbi:phage tail protein [Prosthecomicrobium pneumaticum]|uniref:Microcystin-dependent protein n=1 Tax=Prosthecomicrobium pneumaticum TaxID=81895 RepID=A0A7W9L221_9HYPH|nr:hypothetical protein [Prosthecomicrobium pneumaticum]MBB5753215.1 microcystin-dependent protein [Prosthecomicrobium pneumaticum]
MTTSAIPVGTIVAFALLPANIPYNWLICDGGPVDSSFPLAKLITNTPNLCGTVMVGAGQSAWGQTFTLGNTGGEATHTLVTTEIPSHTHSYSYDNPIGGTGLYGGSYWGPGSVQATTGSAGGGGAHNNMQPYLVVNYIIYAGVPG